MKTALGIAVIVIAAFLSPGGCWFAFAALAASGCRVRQLFGVLTGLVFVIVAVLAAAGTELIHG